MYHSNQKFDNNLTALSEEKRNQAMTRFSLLQSHIEQKIPLSEVARTAQIPVRTARRWLSKYKKHGLIGLARQTRSDIGKRKQSSELISLIKGLALSKSRPSVATIFRHVIKIATNHDMHIPSYSTVFNIVKSINPHLTVLAHHGSSAFRNQYELIHRHRAEKPNALWQADHTQLDIMVIDVNETLVRPWLTIIMDDYSRAVAGFMIFTGAPSALHTSLALRQAIWRKSIMAWPICGIPDVLYVDHGSDFTSIHLEQVAANLKFQLIHSAVARPQGRGKIERLFGTINTELLSSLPGYLGAGKEAKNPALSLSNLEAIINQYFIENYNVRIHSETGETPNKAWIGEGWLTRMPETLEELDLLLVMVAQSRVIRRDGIRFQGLRYNDPILAQFVGETATIRYDPRDITEIRVFQRDRFICRAISAKHITETITLKDIQSARVKYRKALQSNLREYSAKVTDFLPKQSAQNNTSKTDKSKHAPKKRPKLHTYFEDRQSE